MDRTTLKDLRRRAHALPHKLAVGESGLTEPFVAAVDRALASLGLVKVRFPTSDRKARKEQQAAVAAATKSEIVLAIGKVATFWREPEDGAEPPDEALGS